MAAKSQVKTVEKEEFAAPKPLPYLFEKEVIEKQAKHFWIVDDFRPNAVGKNARPIERKFYARHEQQLPQQYQERYTTSVCRFTKELRLPLLESQIYGWLPQHIKHDGKLMKELNFISAPKLRCDMTIYGESFTSGRITERPAFYGLRFFLR